MAYRLPAHLHRNRHGILYFRLAVPADLRPMIGQGEIYSSLNTSSVRQAADAAQALKAELWAIFRGLRSIAMSDEEQTQPTLNLEYLRILMAEKKKLLKKDDELDGAKAYIAELEARLLGAKKQHARELDIAIQAKGGAVIAPKAGMAFESAILEFLDGQRKATTRKTYKGRLEHAQAFFGAAKDIRHIEQADFSEYAAHANKDIANSTTAGFHITTLAGMLNYYRGTKGWGPELTTKRLIEKKDTPDSDDRDSFSLDQLKALFLNAAKYRIEEPHKYWVTVAMPFLGCRIEELAQINLHTDLLQVKAAEIWYLDMNARPDPDGVTRKSMKNKASWRCVPIHSALVRHGFLDYLIGQRKKGFSRPFESGWKPAEFDDGAALKWSHYITNWGGREIKKLIKSGVIVDAAKKLAYFHSMRHQFSGCMGRAKISAEISEAAMGHAYAGAERERYHKLKSNPEQLARCGIEPGLQELAAILPP